MNKKYILNFGVIFLFYAFSNKKNETIFSRALFGKMCCLLLLFIDLSVPSWAGYEPIDG